MRSGARILPLGAPLDEFSMSADMESAVQFIEAVAMIDPDSAGFPHDTEFLGLLRQGQLLLGTLRWNDRAMVNTERRADEEESALYGSLFFARSRNSQVSG